MQVRELLELAGLVSTHGPLLVASEIPLPGDALERYWTASKCRLDRWGRALRQPGRSPESAEARVRPVLEEILAGEVLTRVWTAVLSGYDRVRGTNTAEPIARSVLIGHLEARNRALLRILHGPGITAEEALALNRLRRRAEHWTDLLVARVAGHDDICEFALEPARARRMARQLRDAAAIEGTGTWLLAALRTAFCDLETDGTNDDLNHDVARSILACFQPEHFDSTGLFRSHWLMRLSTAARDTEGMIEQLLLSETQPAPQRETLALDPAFLRRRRLP